MKPSGYALITLLLAAPAADAEVFYVDRSHSGASDSNPGTEASPWLTVQRGLDVAVAGDTVYVKDGVYAEIVEVRRSGDAGAPITVAAFPGDRPTLDGTGLGGWYGIFTIQGHDHLTLSGFEIRNNDTGWGVLVEHEDGDAGNGASFIELVDLDVHHTGGESIQVRGNASDVSLRGCVVHDAVDPSGIDVYQWDGGRPHDVTISGCTAYNFPGFAGIASEQADRLVVESNTVYDSALGIDIGSGDDNVIRDNVVHDCQTGIALSSNEDSEVHDNTISNIADEAIYSYYWIVHGEDHARNKWYGNTVRNAGFAIYESNRKDSRYGEGPTTGHEYFNNVFSQIGAHGAYRTSFYFRGTTNLKLYDNTLVLNDDYDGLELLLGSMGADVRNNIISIDGAVSPVVVDGTSSSGTVVDYNCYHNRSGGSAGPGAHSVTGDPLFAADFYLQASSPCRDAGSDLSAHHTIDMDGIARPQGEGWDIGAHEYAVSTLTAVDGAASEGDADSTTISVSVTLD